MYRPSFFVEPWLNKVHGNLLCSRLGVTFDTLAGVMQMVLYLSEVLLIVYFPFSTAARKLIHFEACKSVKSGPS